MKFSAFFLSALVGTASAFAPSVLNSRSAATVASKSSLGYLPQRFDEAVEYATSSRPIELEELECLADGK